MDSDVIFAVQEVLRRSGILNKKDADKIKHDLEQIEQQVKDNRISGVAPSASFTEGRNSFRNYYKLNSKMKLILTDIKEWTESTGIEL